MSRTDINWDREWNGRMVNNKKDAGALTNDLNENTKYKAINIDDPTTYPNIFKEIFNNE